MKKMLVLMLLAVMSAGVSAALIAYDPFEGNDAADVDTTTGGTGWTGAWSKTTTTAAHFVFSDPGNTFDTLDVAGQKALFLGSGGGTARYNRSISSVTVDGSNPELWFSYILELNETQSGRGCGVELTNGGTSVVALGKGVNKNIGIGTAFTTDFVNTTLTRPGVSFLVLKLEFDGTDTIATIYGAKGDEAGFDISDVATFGATYSITLTGPVTIDGVNLYGYHSSTLTNSIDEVRLGDSYGDFFETDLANTPVPGDTVPGVSLTTDLSWQPPTPSTYIATGYDVWFGTEPNELNIAAYDITQIAVKQAGTTILNADLVTEWGAGLVNGQKYYWYVDAYEPNGLSDILHLGDLWSFTAIPSNVIINDDPVSVTVAAGFDQEVFTVNASNATGYQWYKSTDAVSYTELAGETLASLTLGNVQQDDEGWYFCHVDGIDPQDSAAAQLMTERLVGYWTFDNTLADAESGLTTTVIDPNETDGIPPVWGYGADADAIVGTGSLELNNSDDPSYNVGGWLQIDNSADLFNFYPQGLTISTWIKTPAGQSGEYNEIVSKNAGVTATRLFHRVAGTNGLFRMGSPGATTQQSISDGQWHLMVSTYDPTTGTAQVYLDGTARNSFSPTPETNSAPLTIGGSSSEGAEFGWIGFIDDVKIYTYPRTAEDVAQEYFDVTGKRSCIYEFDGAAVDLSGNCIADIADVAMLAEFWLDNGLYPAP